MRDGALGMMGGSWSIFPRKINYLAEFRQLAASSGLERPGALSRLETVYRATRARLAFLYVSFDLETLFLLRKYDKETLQLQAGRPAPRRILASSRAFGKKV